METAAPPEGMRLDLLGYFRGEIEEYGFEAAFTPVSKKRNPDKGIGCWTAAYLKDFLLVLGKRLSCGFAFQHIRCKSSVQSKPDSSLGFRLAP
jgi:hypothetical protein